MIQGAGVAFVFKVSGAGLRFIFGVVAARLLGAEGAGVLFLALTISHLAAVVGRFGLDNVLLRYLAIKAGKQDWGSVRTIFRKSMFLALTASILITAFLAGTAGFWAGRIFQKPELTGSLILACTIIIPLVFVFLLGEALKAVKKIGRSQFTQGAAIPAFALALIALGHDQHYEANTIIAIYASAALLSAGLGWLFWSTGTSAMSRLQGDFPLKKIITASLPLMVVMICENAIQWAGTLALGVWGTTTEVGIFGAVTRVTLLATFLLSSVNSIAAPKYAVFFGDNRLREVGIMARSTTKLLMALTSPLLAVFIFFPEAILAIFGPDFSPGGPALMIMALGQIFNICTGSVGFILIMGGYQKLLRNITLFSAAINIILTVTLAPSYGINGVAFAALLTLALSNGLKFYAAWLKLGVWAFPWLLPVAARN